MRSKVPTARLAWIAAVLLVLVPGLTACGGGSASGSLPSAAAPVGPRPTGGADLSGTSWVLTAAASASTSPQGRGITLEFTSNQARGNGGVNSFAGMYTAHPDGQLKFGPLISTKKAGDPGRVRIEAEYLKTLDSVTGYSVNAGLLDLFVGPAQVLTYAEK
jgi:heat shock protein HslJ